MGNSPSTSPLVSAPPIVPASQGVSGLSPGARGDFGGLGKPRIYKVGDFWICQKGCGVGFSTINVINAFEHWARSK